jgi:hypothetical protein
MLSVTYAMLSGVYAECHLYWASCILSVIYTQCHLYSVSFILSVVYTQCHLYSVSFMLSVIYPECDLCWEAFLLSVVFADCHLCWVPFMAECHLYQVSKLNKLCWVSLCCVLICNLTQLHSKRGSRGHIFSHVWPFYEWAVSNLDP